MSPLNLLFADRMENACGWGAISLVRPIRPELYDTRFLELNPR